LNLYYFKFLEKKDQWKMCKNNISKRDHQKGKNYNKILGLFDWQIREAFRRWESKNALEDLIGFKLD